MCNTQSSTPYVQGGVFCDILSLGCRMREKAGSVPLPRCALPALTCVSGAVGP